MISVSKMHCFLLYLKDNKNLFYFLSEGGKLKNIYKKASENFVIYLLVIERERERKKETIKLFETKTKPKGWNWQ